MSYMVEEQMDGRVVEVRVGGTLSREAYADFVPRTEAAIRQFGRARLLLVTLGFQGWDAGARWGNVLENPKSVSAVERLAIVGESKWEEGKTDFCLPFTSAEVRYFDHADLSFARDWVKEDL